jgi:hypothetical protein
MDRLSGGELTLALAATLHPLRGTQQSELAAHALPVRSGKICHHMPGVMLDEGVQRQAQRNLRNGIHYILLRHDGY